MPEENEYVDLTNLGRGAAIELLNDALNKVWDNVLDPNTSPKATRNVVLTVTFKPNEERNIASAIIEVKSKLAPPKGVGTVVYIGKDKSGQGVAQEHNPRQPELPLTNNVTNIAEGGGRK